MELSCFVSDRFKTFRQRINWPGRSPTSASSFRNSTSAISDKSADAYWRPTVYLMGFYTAVLLNLSMRNISVCVWRNLILIMSWPLLPRLFVCFFEIPASCIISLPVFIPCRPDQRISQVDVFRSSLMNLTGRRNYPLWASSLSKCDSLTILFRYNGIMRWGGPFTFYSFHLWRDLWVYRIFQIVLEIFIPVNALRQFLYYYVRFPFSGQLAETVKFK